jgi:LPPG:FO 2-phospho-L-lactate transferase
VTGRALRVTLLCGGVGGAKLAHGMALASKAAQDAGSAGLDLSIVANTGDDLEMHGLYVSPDLDTIMYTLAGLANPDTGWGVTDETWSASAMLERYGAPTWFRLGDRDLATHVERTRRLLGGETLTAVTAALAAALDVTARLLPMSDDPVRTEVATADGWLEFQDYFVRRRHSDPVHAIRHAGAEEARATAEVLEAIREADLVVFAPSNPFVSIGTILAVPEILDALQNTPAPIVAVSPIVAGAALRGPADSMLESLGGEATASGIANHYAGRYPGLVDAIVLDTADEDAAQTVESLGMRALVTATVMRNESDRASLAAAIVSRFGNGLVAPAEPAAPTRES